MDAIILKKFFRETDTNKLCSGFCETNSMDYNYNFSEFFFQIIRKQYNLLFLYLDKNYMGTDIKTDIISDSDKCSNCTSYIDYIKRTINTYTKVSVSEPNS